MRLGKKIQRFHFLLGACCLMAAFYYFAVTLPLIREEHDLDERLRVGVSRLATAAHGMDTGEVAAKIELLEAEIEALASIGEDRGRTIQFSPEVEEILSRPFQLIEFDHRKFLLVDRIRTLSQEKGVELPENWEQRLPVPDRQQPYQLWAQLVVMEQLLLTVIEAGVEKIGDIELIFARRNEDTQEAGELEVAVRMQLTGPMKAIHSVVMMLPLNGEELEALGMGGEANPQSSFFLNRFILSKNSAEKADEVTFDFVASGFLDTAPAR